LKTGKSVRVSSLGRPCTVVVAALLAALGGACGGSAAAPTAGGGAGSGGALPISATTVRALRSAPPTTGALVYLKGVVVVARVATSTGGEVWVQDAGGGLGTGILLFCDYAGTVQSCTYDRTSWKQFRRGQVVDVFGVFHKHVGTGAPASSVQLRIESPALTIGTATMDPVATPVTAGEVAMGQLANDTIKGSYVNVAGPLMVSGTSPAEFMTTCSGAAAGTPALHVVGFEGKAGASVLAIGLNLYETVSYCVPDTCPGATCTNPINTQTFGHLLGIVEPHVASAGGQLFLRVSPTVDADLMP
jgi:hypothetical protein